MGIKRLQARRVRQPLQDLGRPSPRSRGRAKPQKLTKGKKRSAAATTRAHRPSGIPRWWPQAALSCRSTSAATRSAFRPRSRLDRVRSEPLGADRAAALRRRREALHPLARQARGRRRGGLRAGGRHQPGQRPAAAEDPARYDPPQHRAQDRQGRPDGPFRRHPAPS